MRAGKYVPLLIGLMWSATSMAITERDVIISCHGCSWTQYKHRALQQAPNNGPNVTINVYVVDRVNRRLAKYRVVKEYSERMLYKYAKSRTPTTAELQIFREDLAAFDEIQKISVIARQLPDHFTVKSAADIYQNMQAQSAIQDWLNDDFLSSRVLAFSYFFGEYLLARFTADIRIIFPDGSEAVFHVSRFELEFSLDGIKLELRYTEDTAVGPEGNALPDTIDDLEGFRGSFYFDDSLNTFLRRVQLLGLPVTNFPGVPTSCDFLSGKLVCYVDRK
ncbi:MAG: hypothetical protein O6946_06880 [Gammaproteobacteria bacterium]|nr:hypothetical protein [Gammaproteobacteria bacterium]MCZ6716772.1 hypothetical protein [Gammaproteobacteria bacterium]MCZ6827268.1 hypothetical protein [Gammaproteobacteria bacterium]MCZ6911354.1 hypothetical protein [Pseudomonadota bacterium]